MWASAYARWHYERKIKPHSEKREQMRQRSRDYIRRRREEERRGTKQQLAQEMELLRQKVEQKSSAYMAGPKPRLYDAIKERDTGLSERRSQSQVRLSSNERGGEKAVSLHSTPDGETFLPAVQHRARAAHQTYRGEYRGC